VRTEIKKNFDENNTVRRYCEQLNNLSTVLETILTSLSRTIMKIGLNAADMWHANAERYNCVTYSVLEFI